MFDSLKLSDLSKGRCSMLRRPTSTRPAIWAVEENGVRAVVKDFSPNKFPFRNTIGRFLVWRESKAYRKIGNLRGIPALIRIIDGLALVIEEIPGRSLENLEKEMRLTESFFRDLRHLVDQFHQKGVAHCDLKRAPNVILGSDGLPYIVDWGAAISESECRVFPFNLIYRRFLLDDDNAIIKLKLRHVPGAVTPKELEGYKHRNKTEKLIRSLRDRLRDFLKTVS